MANIDSRIRKAQKVLQEDASGLGACETQDLDRPLQFNLVLSGASLDKSELEACLGLVEYTSKDDYTNSSIGWDRRKKREEMQDPDMIYLLVREKKTTVEDAPKDTPRVLGYISFMLTYDDHPHEDREVVYIYEIHLDEPLRGQGLGSRLIGFVEHVARECHIGKTMLTVFTANKGAKKLYETLGYTKDACSPGDRVMRTKTIKADYVIMSKMTGS